MPRRVGRFIDRNDKVLEEVSTACFGSFNDKANPSNINRHQIAVTSNGEYFGELPMAKILAVDDAASIRQLVKFTLQNAGHEVHEADSGKQALQKAHAEGSFDLVISDMNMPEMDGITLIKELRGKEKFKFTPILLLTTESGAEKKSNGKAAGATGWIVKPFNPEQLVATINKVL